MSLKVSIATILFLTFSSVTFCQDYRKEIETQFLIYNDLIVQKEFNKSMDFVPEKLFEIVPRDQMVLLLEKTFNDSEMEFELEGPQNIEVSEIKEIEGKRYSIIKYSSPISMKFNGNEEKAETETEQKLRVNIVKLSFEHAFGPDNVRYDEGTGFYKVTAQKQAVAISNEKAQWQFLVIEKEQKAILNRLLPKELIDKI